MARPSFLLLISAKTKKLNRMHRELGYELRSLRNAVKKVSKSDLNKKTKVILDRVESLSEYYKTGYLADILDHAEQIRSNMFFRFQGTKPNNTQETGKLQDAIISKDFIRIVARGTSAQNNMSLVGIANVKKLDEATMLQKQLYNRIYGIKNKGKSTRSKVYKSTVMPGERIVGHWEFQEAGPVNRDFILNRRKDQIHKEDRAILKSLVFTLIKNSKNAFTQKGITGGRNFVI